MCGTGGSSRKAAVRRSEAHSKSSIPRRTNAASVLIKRFRSPEAAKPRDPQTPPAAGAGGGLALSGAKDEAGGRAVRVEFSVLVHDAALGGGRPAAEVDELRLAAHESGLGRHRADEVHFDFQSGVARPRRQRRVD